MCEYTSFKVAYEFVSAEAPSICIHINGFWTCKKLGTFENDQRKFILKKWSKKMVIQTFCFMDIIFRSINLVVCCLHAVSASQPADSHWKFSLDWQFLYFSFLDITISRSFDDIHFACLWTAIRSDTPEEWSWWDDYLNWKSLVYFFHLVVAMDLVPFGL